MRLKMPRAPGKRNAARVNRFDALSLIAAVVPRGPAVWADFGAGHGTFAQALADQLGPAGRVYAVDRDGAAIAWLERLVLSRSGRIIPLRADFAGRLVLPGISPEALDGMLLANALHYVRDAACVLVRLTEWLRPERLRRDRRLAGHLPPLAARVPAINQFLDRVLGPVRR
jgi:SAM-dependent methyltransferase